MIDTMSVLLSRLTAARVAFVDAAISSLISTAVNSVQTGSITIPGDGVTTSATATITAVNVSRSELVWRGTDRSSNTTTDYFGRASLTNSTTVTHTNVAAGIVRVLHFTVVEYK